MKIPLWFLAGTSLLFSQAVQFDSIPQNLQLYPRLASDSGLVIIKGSAEAGHDSLVVRVFRNAAFRARYHADLASNPSFRIAVPIPAELAEYRFQVYLDDSLVATADSVVAGDVYLADGSSNSYYGTGWRFEYVRTFDLAPDTQWTYGSTGCWSQCLGNRINRECGIPVAVFNVGASYTSISSHFRNNADIYSGIFGNMLYRTWRGGVRDQARAVLWYQGEYEALSANGYATYAANFDRLYHDWKSSFPGVERVYVFQINMYSSFSWRVREVQRHLKDAYPDVKVFATVGTPGFNGHYTDSGYSYLANRVFKLVKRDLYPGTDDTLLLSSPDLIKANFSSTLKDEITLVFDQPVLWPESDSARSYLNDYFFVNDSFGLVDSGWSVPNEKSIRLKLASPRDSVHISYIRDSTAGHPFNTSFIPEQFLRNPNGMAALAFHGIRVEPAGAADTQTITALRFLGDTLRVEQYLQAKALAEAVYSGGWRDTNHLVFFHSEDTAQLRVSIDGVVTARNPGLSHLIAEKKGFRDTLPVRVMPSSATVEALSFKADTIHLLIHDTADAHLTAYYRKDGRISIVRCDTLAAFSAGTAPLRFSHGRMTASEAGGPWKVTASLGLATASIQVVAHAMPPIVRKINFQAPRSWVTSLGNGWVIDSGGPYNASKGFGWLVGGYAQNLKEGDYLEATYAYPRGDRPGVPITFKMDVPDGGYLIKLCNRAEYNMVRPILFGTDTLLANILPYHQRAYAVRKIHVAGGEGCVLTIYGNICYLILVSDNGAPMELFSGNLPNPPSYATIPKADLGMAGSGPALSVFPNPVNSAAVLSFRLAQGRGGKVSIFNLKGQKIREFIVGNGSGEGRITWDRRNAQNKPMPSGLYFARLEAQGATMTRKLTLIK